MKGIEQIQYTQSGRKPSPKMACVGLGLFSLALPCRADHSFRRVFLVRHLQTLFPESFAVIIEAYGIIPDGWVTPMSIGLPVLEVILAVGLLLDIRGSLAGTAALLALFMAILGYGIHLGLDVDCGCFGPEDPEAEAFHGLRSAFYRMW